jgi:hypothetical protein
MEITLLQQDLDGGGRDATYRAMSFIARSGGPRISAAAGEFAELNAQRADMLAWLKAQPGLVVLAADYVRYCEQWSPIFRE